MEFICRTFEGPWPRRATPAYTRKLRPFKSGWDVTLRKLRYELAQLEATTVVLQTAHTEKQISFASGWPRADVAVAHPGVVLIADTKHGSLKWICDDCARWTDNCHAIALTLERLRLADLYGVTGRGEQCLGWKMLPGPITAGDGKERPMSIDQAARFVADLTGVCGAGGILRSKAEWESAYRAAVKICHPDVKPNDPRWQKLQEASTLIGALHNKK